MAIIKNGILGGFKGKAGIMVGYHLNGQDIMRERGRKRSVPYTAKELTNQRKFAASQKWLQPLVEFLRVGFQDYAPTYQGFVAAKSYNSKHALKGIDPFFYIDPALALVSFGTLNQATIANAVSENANCITFSWSGGKYDYDDRAMFVAYDVENGEARFDTAAVRRQMKRGTFILPSDFAGKQVHGYLAFVSEDRKKRSNSQYLGVITVL